MNVLRRTEFGNQVLRTSTKNLSITEVKSNKIQKLIKDMRHTLHTTKLGVGLAAPQVGEAISLSVISIQPTSHRPDVEDFELVIINPVIIETYGRKTQMWEGCISGGTGNAGLFAKVPRYKKVTVKYIDETGTRHTDTYKNLIAHVLQHEIDHLNGILFVDRVKDTKTYTTYKEYIKIVKTTKK